MVASALLAGLGAGLFAAALQFLFVQPVLMEAELYETGARVHVASAPGGHDHGHPAAEPVKAGPAAPTEAGPGSGDPAPAAPVDWRRNTLLVGVTTLVYCGYGLLLVAGVALAEMRGERITARSGILWGLAGFIALHFAPAVGLPPELPGMSAADLTDRQIWWAATVAATGIGVWLVAFGKTPAAWGSAVILLAAPHLIGAPHPDQLTGPVPPELGALFAGRTLGVGMAVWVVLGLLVTTLWTRQDA